MIERGIYLPPSQFECIFLSMAHSREDFDRTEPGNDVEARQSMVCGEKMSSHNVGY